MLPAAAFSGELDEPRIFISFFSCVEKSGPAHHLFTLTQFFGMFFKTTHFFYKKANHLVCLYVTRQIYIQKIWMPI